MGHLIFVMFHIIAILFTGWLLLFLTIPLHLIYAAASKKPKGPSPWTDVFCPDCKEFIHKEANVCKHCGCKLVPASQQRSPPSFLDRAFNGAHQRGVKRPE